MKNKPLYYILNLTWGLPLTLVGAVVALGLMFVGKRPKMYGPCIHFEIGKAWGGLSLGLFIFTNENVTDAVKLHELGHTFQNAIFGPFMIPLALISCGRYWLYNLFGTFFVYDSFWLEDDASDIGNGLWEMWTEDKI